MIASGNCLVRVTVHKCLVSLVYSSIKLTYHLLFCSNRVSLFICYYSEYRHEVYKNQYRAMFVLNCRVQRDEVLKQVPKQSKGSRKRWRKGRSGEAAEHSNDSEASYHPVRCSECNTEVAVIDTDEVFHFFNVLASFPN